MHHIYPYTARELLNVNSAFASPFLLAMSPALADDLSLEKCEPVMSKARKLSLKCYHTVGGTEILLTS